MNSNYFKGIENAYSLISQANSEMIDLWWKYTFLVDWQWWLGITLTIVPWVLWIIFRKKESTYRLLLAGFFALIVSSWFDLIGILFGLWSYYHKVIPLTPAFFPWDFSLIPVTIMFLLQIKPDTKPLIKGILFSIFTSFIAEPVFVWLDIYNPKHWEYIYSFPIYIIIYLLCDWFSKRQHFDGL